MKRKIFSPLLLIAFISVFSLKGFAKVNDDPKKEKPLIATLSATNYSSETAKGLVFVDFWAAWCGPCRKMAPILDQLATEYKGTLKIGKLNVDNYKKFSIDNGIEALPTIVVYKDGKEMERIKGLVTKEALEGVIKKYTTKSTN